MSASLGRILVADDEPSFRKLVVRLLEREGYTVEHAADANEALERLSSRVFDLLVADVNMPGNYQLAVLHRQDAVPVLVVTGAPTVDTAVAALRGAAVDYLSKPVLPELLLARVAVGVARGRAMQTLKTTQEQLRSQLELVTNMRETMRVAGGPTPMRQELPKLPKQANEALSQREREVLIAFRATPRSAEVAERLNISQHTVKNHFKSIYRKLGVNSQAELLTLLAELERRE